MDTVCRMRKNNQMNSASTISRCNLTLLEHSLFHFNDLNDSLFLRESESRGRPKNDRNKECMYAWILD